MSEKEAFYKILKSKEKFDFNLEENYYDSDTLMYISKLRRLNNIKISHKVDKKPNRTIADQTIYSTRTDSLGNEWIIKKRKDIYGDDGIKVAQDFLLNKGENYLIANHDIKTYELLLSIVENYAKDFGITSPKQLKDNPFKDYTDKNGPIRKFSKKNNGPIITSLKYKDSRLGNHLDITDNFTNDEKTAKDKRVVLLQISPYRTDFYKDSNNNYHFVTIRYAHIKYSEKTGKHYIEEDKYNELLKSKNIPTDAKFMFSFHRDEYIRIVRTTKGEIEDKTWRFITTNDDIKNVIEVKSINERDRKAQNRISIGTLVYNIEKLHVDILGNRYLVNKEALKLEF